MVDLTPRTRQILGWTAVGLSTLAACFWAFWGVLENFHEGWFDASLGKNLGGLVVHYLLLMDVFVASALVAIRWPVVGAGVHAAFALTALWFFRRASPALLCPFIVGPLAGMAVCYGLGRPRPRRRAAAVAALRTRRGPPGSG